MNPFISGIRYFRTSNNVDSVKQPRILNLTASFRLQELPLLFLRSMQKIHKYPRNRKVFSTRMQAVSLHTASGRHTQLGMFALFKLSRSKLPDSDVLSQTTGT